jgi:hypothetical protein
MSTTALFVEFLIIGLIVLLTSIFGVLIVFNIYDISMLVKTKDYITIIVIFLLVFSYLLGISIHRISLLILRLCRNIISQKNKSKKSKNHMDFSIWFNEQIMIRQYGSDNLIKYVDYELSLGRILNTSTFVYPLLILTSSIWILHAINFKVSLIISIMNIVIYIVIISATYVQRKIYQGLILQAYNFLDETKSH